MTISNEFSSELEQLAHQALKRVIDPEIGENIVDLGLVYGLEIDGDDVTVKLTMTTPACPMGELIMDEVHAELTHGLPENMKIDIQLVWEPPWDPSMMSVEAKQKLGWK